MTDDDIAVRAGHLSKTFSRGQKRIMLYGGPVIMRNVADMGTNSGKLRKDRTLGISAGSNPGKNHQSICHRYYGRTSHVHIRIFDDRIEVWNTGKLTCR